MCLLVINQLFCLHCSYLSKQSSKLFLLLKEGKLHIFACVAVLQQELTKFHKRIAWGEAQHFQHFFCFQVQLLLQQIFGLLPPLFCHSDFCFVLPYVTRERRLCRVTRQATGLEGQSHNAMIIAGGCNGGKNNLIFKLIR